MTRALLFFTILAALLSIASSEQSAFLENYRNQARHDIERTPLLKRLANSTSTDLERTLLDRLVKGWLFPHETQTYYLLKSPKMERKVVVFFPASFGWPGNNTQVIAITDSEDALLAWREVGGEPIPVATALAWNPDNPVLEIVCKHRPSFDWSLGVYRYSLKYDQINLIQTK
jgi:hypothetical protein